MARRRVQYGIVDASDADVGAGAPGFRTTWHTKEDLREQLMEIDDVPKDGRLYFWDGELWLRWEALDDLPGPEQDPLRIKVVRPQNAGLSVQWRHQQVAVGDEDLEDVGGRMTRVLLASTGECIGTAARIQQDGLTVSCRHVFVDDGNFLNAIGWGEKLAFVASSPHDDIVLLQGPPGRHFDMTAKVLQLGRPVLMAGFPAASHQDFPRRPAGQPMITAGTICCYDRDFELAAATYQGAMPNSSGAPVLDDTRSLRGVHVGTCYHLDELHAQNQDSMAAPRKIETSVDELWVEELQPAQKPSSSLNTISSDLSAMSLAQHACANIPHKAFIGMFVPHNRLLQILEGLSLFPNDALRHTKQGNTMSKLTNKRPRGN